MSNDSARQRLLDYFFEHVGENIHRDKLAKIADVHDWARVIRSLRQEGYKIVTVKPHYILESLVKSEKGNKRIGINHKLRYEILHRDNSTCQRCGRTVSDGVKFQIDHKIPVEWGGKNDVDNLWTLCTDCNGGKKDLFRDYDEEVMKEIVKEDSGYRKLMLFFQLTANEIIEPIKLEIISGIRDWERTLRLIRKKEKMNILWIKPNAKYPKGGYIYSLNSK